MFVLCCGWGEMASHDLTEDGELVYVSASGGVEMTRAINGHPCLLPTIKF